METVPQTRPDRLGSPGPRCGKCHIAVRKANRPAWYKRAHQHSLLGRKSSTHAGRDLQRDQGESEAKSQSAFTEQHSPGNGNATLEN